MKRTRTYEKLMMDFQQTAQSKNGITPHMDTMLKCLCALMDDEIAKSEERYSRTLSRMERNSKLMKRLELQQAKGESV